MHIVVVNYRTPELTIDCLHSLAGDAAEMPELKVVITDNASGDDSVPRIEDAIRRNGWEDWARVVPLPRNGGFAYGNNRGIEVAGDAQYVLLLNSDTIVPVGTLRHCREVMEREHSIGALSCMLLSSDSTVQENARRFPTPLRQTLSTLGLPWILPRLFGWANINDPGWDRRTVKRDVDWLGGAFLLIRGDLLRRIGPLDEDFFFYGEDIEFCHRVWRAGYRCHYDPQASITHLGGGSSDVSRVSARQRSVYFWQARYLVQRKCYGRIAAAWLRGVDVLTSALRCMKLLATGRRRETEYRFQRDLLSMLLRPLRVSGASQGGAA
jgi:N-acetylglucosaminyl-diphospho-decaprenol L-rhamnosyltransferase